LKILTLLLSVFCLVCTAQAVAEEVSLHPPAAAVPRTLFGMHIHHYQGPTPWPDIDFGSIRLWDMYGSWKDLEYKKGDWHFGAVDKYVTAAQQHNVEPVLTLALSPTWASSRPNDPPNGFPAEPKNIDDWRDYIRTVAGRYKNKVHYYEMWNEPNYNKMYSGDTRKMVELVREANRIIKEVSPDARIISPSPTFGDKGIEWLADFLRQGGGQYVDIIGFHYYVSGGPESMLGLIQRTKDTMARYGAGDKPIWDTEATWPITNGTPGSHGLSFDDASAYISRGYLLQWAAGVERWYFYAWDDRIEGLITPDGADKPTAKAYAEVERWMVGARMDSCRMDGQGNWTAHIIRPDQREAWIVWNSKVKLGKFKLPSEWNVQSVTDIYGKKSPVRHGDTIEVHFAPELIESAH
jgi:hypothetical protein